MSLILPRGPAWAHCTDNLPSTLSATAIGTTVIAPNDGTEGQPAALLSAALTHDVEYIRLGFAGFQATSENTSTALDLLIDPAGGTNYSELITDLLVGGNAQGSSGSASAAGIARWFDFPLWIPAGAALAARARTKRIIDNLTGYVVVQAWGGNANPASWWCGQRVTTLGIDATEPRGTPVTPGYLDWGSWTNVGAVTPTDCGALQWMTQIPNSASISAEMTYWQLGVDGTPFGPTIQKTAAGQEATWSMPTGPIFTPLPAGTQLQLRGKSSYSFPQAYDAAVYLVS